MPRFEGRIALVTGASSGIGRATAAMLADEGATVVAAARNEEPLLDAIATWARPAEHHAIAADVSSEEGVGELFKRLRELRGSADVAVFAAGQHLIRPLSMTGSRHIEDVLRGNVMSSLLCTKEFVKLPPREGRSIVWVSSAAALIGGAGEAAYAAAKGALGAACRAVAVEGGRKYRVNCVAPGVVKTRMSDAWLGRLTPEQRTAVEQRHLLGFGDPEDVAAAILFLASGQAKWITGTCLTVDGGLTCH